MTRTIPAAPRLARWMDLAILLSAGAALLVASAVLILFQFLALRQNMAEDVSVQARIVGENCEAALLFQDSHAAHDTLAAFEGAPSVQEAVLYIAQGEVLAHFRRAGLGGDAPAPLAAGAGHRFSLTGLELVHPVTMDGRTLGILVVRARLDELYARLGTYAGLTLAVALASMLVAYLLVARMRGAVRRAESHLEYLAHTDPVTGLPNRHAFNEHLRRALADVDQYGAAVGLLLIDLDNFKIVNDTLGHHCGDLLLKQAARRLLECVPEEDVVCRIGGDEFAVILAAGIDGECKANRLLAALAAPFELEGREIYVTASIGIGRYPDDAANQETLIRNVDTAMYQAKSKGKNAFETFHPELDRRIQKRLALETSLRKALEREEFTLHYQPQFATADGRLVGLEALLRWNHPELGPVSPGEFIPVAEDSGLILPIGRWVLRSACAQMGAWRNAGFGSVCVSVNLSAHQMRDPTLMHDILAALHEHRIEPGQLELEITETVLMENVQENLELLHQLQAEGIRLSIDDFGTGYSSMAYLKRLPINQVKIDRTFVRDIPGDRDDEAITSAIIAMAHNLGLSVVAEGVETREQLEFLRAAGCDVMQGYYFAEPRCAQQVAVYLHKPAPRAAATV